MFDFFRRIFGVDFMPHLYCLRSDPGVLWTQVISDLLVAISYFAIPLVLLRVVLKRKEPLFRRLAILFVLFIAACGTTHLLAVWTIWHPMYRLEAVVKALTALLSAATAVVLLGLRRQIEDLPSVAELQKEIDERRRVQQADSEREERFRNFVEGVQDYAIFMLDPAGCIKSWNLGAERIHGYTSDGIIGQHFSCFYPPPEPGHTSPEDSLRIAVEVGKFEEEGWRVRKDGSRFWANVIIRPLRNSAGELAGFSKVTRDLSESQEMEAKFKTLMEATPDALLITNRNGLIVFANRQVENLFGYGNVDVMGKSVDLLLPERFRGGHVGHRRSFFDAPKSRAMGTGQELLGRAKDGREFAVEISLSPLETSDGLVALAAIRDVSERKQAEERFRALLDSAPDAMVISGGDGLIELANRQAEALFGYSREEMIGQRVEILIPADLRSAYEEDTPAILQGDVHRKTGEGQDLRARRKDGSEFPVEISFSPLQGAKGTSVTAAIRDITDRKRAQEQLGEKMRELSHSNEALEQFAHIASHDLQEPLRMVASYTQLLARRYKGRLDKDADEFIAYAVDGTQRMKRLIEDLLLYSRAGKGGPPMREFSSEAALREALENLRVRLEETGAKVTQDALPVITGSEAQVVQIFQNLIGNALKYRGDRVPVIHVSSQKGKSEWIFSVTDNGIGIDSRYFERIFQIFQRLHGREEYEGTGIGLAICQRILHQQGGRIWVDSVLGEGSTFYFSIVAR
jgi:PAS domain S-box-containing protein